jgi:hypothetical protein
MRPPSRKVNSVCKERSLCPRWSISTLTPRREAWSDTAFDAAAVLFTAAKLNHLNALPQGQPQRDQRTVSMVAAMATEGFGSCANYGECEGVCPKEIPLEFIGTMNRDLIRAAWRRHREPLVIPAVVQQPFHEHHGTEEGRP